VLASVPSAYAFWQWSHAADPFLPGLSYTAFDQRLSDAPGPALWTYMLWVFLVFIAMSLLTNFLALVLQRAFPQRD